MDKILAVAYKDLLRSFRSLFAVGMMVAAPLLLTGLIYFAFDGLADGADASDMQILKVVVVNQDRSATEQIDLGKMLVEFLQDDQMPEWLEVTELGSREEAVEAISRRQAGAAILVPPDFTAVLYQPDRTGAVTILHDPALSIGPNILRSLIVQFLDGVGSSRVAVEVVSQRLSASGIQPDAGAYAAISQRYSQAYTALQQNINHASAPVFVVSAPSPDPAAGQEAEAVTANPMAAILSLIMAGQMAFFAFFTGGFTTSSIVQEQEDGTLARMFATPTPRTTILAGKFTAVFVTVLIQTLVLLAASTLAFDIQWGKPGAVALAVVGQVLAASGLGMFLISLIKSTRQTGIVLGGGMTVLGMAGGLFTVGFTTLPAAFKTINFLTPHGWVIESWKLATSGASAVEILPTVLAAAAIGIALASAGAVLFRKRLA